jgi:hypothetical protein
MRYLVLSHFIQDKKTENDTINISGLVILNNNYKTIVNRQKKKLNYIFDLGYGDVNKKLYHNVKIMLEYLSLNDYLPFNKLCI